MTDTENTWTDNTGKTWDLTKTFEMVEATYITAKFYEFVGWFTPVPEASPRPVIGIAGDTYHPYVLTPDNMNDWSQPEPEPATED